MKMNLNPGFTKAFGIFLEKLREIVKRDTAGQVSPAGPYVWDVTHEEGYKYIRVVLVSKSGDDVKKTPWGFVEKRTGDIFRAASWKAPCLNHTRGSIYDEHHGLKHAAWTGPAYIWEIDEEERNRVPILSSRLDRSKKKTPVVEVAKEEPVAEPEPEPEVEVVKPSAPTKIGSGNMSIAAQIAAHIAQLEGKIA